MSIGLTAAELAQIRSDVADLLPDTCDILSVTLASDGQGGQVETWGTVSADVACRLDYQRGRESVTGAALMSEQLATLSMAYNGTITPANRVLLSGDTYGVVSVNDNQSWIGVIRVIVERIR